jgi:Lrp/AsnC family transcriptional regulator for asnA, asnC and gidA
VYDITDEQSFTRVKEWVKELKKIPQVVRVNYTTGNYSMFVEIVCKDIGELRFILHDELQKIKGIERTETLISLEESFSRNVIVKEG